MGVANPGVNVASVLIDRGRNGNCRLGGWYGFQHQDSPTEYIRKMARGSDKDRQRAHDDLVTLAREIGDKNLEKFAGDVKAYYDQAWQLARSQLAIMEIRAQMSNLKRPIPTIQTSTVRSVESPATVVTSLPGIGATLAGIVVTFAVIAVHQALV